MPNKKINCAYCGKETVYGPENTFRPFCSERCQLMDLGKWASEKFAIPGEKAEPSNEVNENEIHEDEEPSPPPRYLLN